MTWVDGALLVLCALGTAYYVVSAAALIACFTGKPPVSETAPKVSVLKPVCGVDHEAAANLASYLSLDYPDYEVLFGVLEATDPAIGVILETIQGHKNASLHIGTTIRGANNKVRVLHQLAKHARGDILVVTDADTRATPDFLGAVVAAFGDESVGVVTCLYKGILGSGIADALEGLHMTCIFAPGVACARGLGMLDFGLGAAVAIRGKALHEIGGFEPMADYLADDYQLGNRSASVGHKVVLSRYVVDDVLSGQGLREVLARELRWSRTTRISRPAGHFGLVVTFGFAYALAYAVATGFSATGWACLGSVAAIRLLTAWIGARKCLGDKDFARRAWLLPVRDVLSFAVWVAGYLGQTVTWRGRRLRVAKDGRIRRE